MNAGNQVVDGTIVFVGGDYGRNIDTAYTLAPPEGARIAHIISEGQDFRYKSGGTTPPTATDGMPWSKGVGLPLGVDDLSKVKIIGQAAGGKANIEYFK